MWAGNQDRIGFWSAPGDYELKAADYWRAADGGDDPKQVLDTDLQSEEGWFYGYSFSTDGDLLLGTAARSEDSPEFGIAFRTLAEPGRNNWLVEPRDGLEADSVSLSPDGNWVLYVSNESGEREAYIIPFETEGGSVLISGSATGWVRYPQWSPDGTKIYYQQGGQMWVADVTTTPDFMVTGRRSLFALDAYWATSGNYTLSNWDVAPDGESFLMIRGVSEWVPPRHINVIVNFFEELNRLLPTDGSQ